MEKREFVVSINSAIGYLHFFETLGVMVVIGGEVQLYFHGVLVLLVAECAVKFTILFH